MDDLSLSPLPMDLSLLIDDLFFAVLFHLLLGLYLLLLLYGKEAPWRGVPPKNIPIAYFVSKMEAACHLDSDVFMW